MWSIIIKSAMMEKAFTPIVMSDVTLDPNLERPTERSHAIPVHFQVLWCFGF